MNPTPTIRLLLKEEVYQIVSCAIEVLNALGHGLHEKPYENALVVEFDLRGIPCSQQKRFDLSYKGRNVGLFVPDLLVYDAVVVDAKVIDRITDFERGQMLNYLRITKLRVGVILNFREPETRMGTNRPMIQLIEKPQRRTNSARATSSTEAMRLPHSCPFVFIRG